MTAITFSQDDRFVRIIDEERNTLSFNLETGVYTLQPSGQCEQSINISYIDAIAAAQPLLGQATRDPLYIASLIGQQLFWDGRDRDAQTNGVQDPLTAGMIQRYATRVDGDAVFEFGNLESPLRQFIDKFYDEDRATCRGALIG